MAHRNRKWWTSNTDTIVRMLEDYTEAYLAPGNSLGREYSVSMSVYPHMLMASTASKSVREATRDASGNAHAYDFAFRDKKGDHVEIIARFGRARRLPIQQPVLAATNIRIEFTSTEASLTPTEARRIGLNELREHPSKYRHTIVEALSVFRHDAIDGVNVHLIDLEPGRHPNAYTATFILIPCAPRSVQNIPESKAALFQRMAFIIEHHVSRSESIVELPSWMHASLKIGKFRGTPVRRVTTSRTSGREGSFGSTQSVGDAHRRRIQVSQDSTSSQRKSARRRRKGSK